MESYRGKRVLDLILVTVTSPIWVPLGLVIGALVWLWLGSPVLFRQARVGRNGRIFKIVKFRSMLESRDGDLSTLPDAERVTRFGRWLRSSSLDELPELVNVLAGDMSLVGPRPLLTRYLTRYSARHQRRHAVRPGVTGLAQVTGRNDIEWAEKFELDLTYVQECSFWLDMRILFLTVSAVIMRKGITAPGDATAPEFTGYERQSGSSPPEDS